MTLLFPNPTLAFCNFSEAKHYHHSYTTPFEVSRNLYVLPDLSVKRSLNKRKAKQAKHHLGQRNCLSSKDYRRFKFKTGFWLFLTTMLSDQMSICNFSRPLTGNTLFKNTPLISLIWILLVMELYGFLKVQLQATLSRHDKGSTTLPEGVSTGKQRNGNLHTESQLSNLYPHFKTDQFHQVGKKSLQRKYFSFTTNSNRSEYHRSV